MTPAEAAHFAEVATWTAEDGGYAHQQVIKPSTLGVGLNYSPAGLAAWIGEKVVAWISMTPDDQPAFDRDLLLSTLTLQWCTATIMSSIAPYWAFPHTPPAVRCAPATRARLPPL